MPKLASLMDEAETDVLAYMGFPARHQRARYMTLQTIAPLSDDLGVSLPAVAA